MWFATVAGARVGRGLASALIRPGAEGGWSGGGDRGGRLVKEE